MALQWPPWFLLRLRVRVVCFVTWRHARFEVLLNDLDKFKVGSHACAAAPGSARRGYRTRERFENAVLSLCCSAGTPIVLLSFIKFWWNLSWQSAYEL